MKIDLADILLLAGIAALLSGLYLFDPRWALVGGGVLALVFALRLEVKQK